MLQSIEWNYFFISKIQRCKRLSLVMDKEFHPARFNGCNYVSMLELKLSYVSKRGT